MKRLLPSVFVRAVVLATAVLSLTPAQAAEGTLRIAEQFGIPYLPYHVIRDQKLIEKHGAAQGLDIKVEWRQLNGGAVINDALLSGSLDIGTGGIGPVLTIWDRTKGNANVRGIASLGNLPSFLVTRNDKVKSLKDFTQEDKIALPAIGVSVQSRTLQIAAEKELGIGKHAALDDLTVSLSHPDGTAALLAGNGAITAHFTVAPFQYLALKDPKIHKVLSSYDVLGGPATSNIAYTTEKFRNESPKTYRAFLAALREAVAWINANKDAAAATYIRAEQSKLDPAFIRNILDDKDIEFKTVPERTHVYADFLFRTGQLKNKAGSWRDYFFEDVYSAEGS